MAVGSACGGVIIQSAGAEAAFAVGGLSLAPAAVGAFPLRGAPGLRPEEPGERPLVILRAGSNPTPVFFSTIRGMPLA